MSDDAIAMIAALIGLPILIVLALGAGANWDRMHDGIDNIIRAIRKRKGSRGHRN